MKITLSIVFIAFILLLPSTASALRNPAAAYCVALGYEYKTDPSSGGVAGYCVLSDGRAVGGWQFLQGKVAQEYGYCARQGYTQKTVKDWKKCLKFMLESCSVCVLEDGREIEVTELMGLSFDETTCGDGKCGFPETFKTCPSDCPSGSRDEYCDGVKDGKCDPDCTGDPDCR